MINKTAKTKKLTTLWIITLILTNITFANDPNLIGHWKMLGPTQGESTRFVRDYSGNAHHGTMGSSDTWLDYGAIDFNGGSWGASGIVFENDGYDIVANLNDQVTISYVVTWDTVTSTNYPYDGRDSANQRILSSECPTSNHIRDHKGGTDMWCWEAFNETDPRFIFGAEKTWGDFIRITTTVNFNTGDYKIYVDNDLYASATGKTGSFSDLQSFTIGKTLWAEMEGTMYDFRIYDRELSAAEIQQLDDNYDYSLRAWYKFEETSGSIAHDSSGNGFDATLNSSTKWNPNGAIGRCLSNDNAWGTFIGNVPANAFDTIDNKITIATWICTTDNCENYGWRLTKSKGSIAKQRQYTSSRHIRRRFNPCKSLHHCRNGRKLRRSKLYRLVVGIQFI